MAHAFYPFVENDDAQPQSSRSDARTHTPLPNESVGYAARIAVYDDAAAAPRVVVVDPSDIRSYLEEITKQVTALSHEQGGTIPFTVIREIVENLIHAYFIEPTISILDGGNTIRFSDQGPGIKEKKRALEYGTSTATEEMKRYIRGVGSGLPYVQQYMEQKGGCLLIEDNLSQGTVVTISTKPPRTTAGAAAPEARDFPQRPATGEYRPQAYPDPRYQQAPPQTAGQPYAVAQGQYPQGQPWQGDYGYTPYQQPAWPSYGGAAYTPPSPQQARGQYAPPVGYPAPQGSPQGYQASPTAAGGSYAAQQQVPAPVPSPPEGESPSPDSNDNPFSWITLTERGRDALAYLNEHETVGPSDLQRAYGGSQPTWTRELKLLEDAGLVKKSGQKRHLTDLGRAYIQRAR